ncbi:MAG: Gfo/Idh/MocA family oxidoreductase [Bdellovibrionales bacterium]|nr:Gfo/Idh/MocA family oxidoreductase [Bdellovibrionales bacterium]
MTLVPTRCAVVGVGHLGKFHAQKYKAISSAELVGVCDTSAERAKAVAEELSCKAFTNPKELIGHVDAVTIAASTPAHYELCKLFLSSGVHVHVEKPMTETSKQGRELCDLAEQKKIKFQVGHVERFNPALVAAREKLAKPLFIECTRLAPFKPRSIEVDVVLDLMIHDLDVILSLVKSPVKEVSAVGTPVLTQTADIANARIEFENGTIANVTASRVSQKSQRKFRVFQRDQYLSIDFGTGEVNLLTKTGEWNEGEVPIDAEAWNLEKGDALLAETQSFVEAIQIGQPVVVSGRDGLVALELAEKVIEEIKARYA